MSAYMVEDKTINKVVTYLRNKFAREWQFLYRKFEDQGFRVDSIDFCDKLGRAMFELNMRGVDSRYGTGASAKFRALDYTYKPEYNIPIIWVFKALESWIYQCSEGDVCDDPFYKLMAETKHVLAEHIVTRLPEYENAPWG